MASKLIVRPTDSVIYNVELPRLTAKIDKLDAALKKNKTDKGLATYTYNLQEELFYAISRVCYNSYVLGASHVKTSVLNSDQIKLVRENKARAKQAAQWISASTKSALGISAAMSPKYTLGNSRALTDAANELGIAFYLGVSTGWALYSSARKEWWVSNRHDKDDTCDDNMDEGPIDIKSAFQSGHFYPPAHINCSCRLALIGV